MAGKSVAKYVVLATGKVDGKAQMWVCATFPGIAQAKPWVALLNLARKSKDAETILAMDVHQPGIADHKVATDVKYSGLSVQYAPEASALSENAELG
jgi:hypothetical protein